MADLFRKVYTKDRHPTEYKRYDTNIGNIHFLGFSMMNVEWWLEEVELPTYKETTKERDSYTYSRLDPFRWGWKYGVQHVLNLIKGGK